MSTKNFEIGRRMREEVLGTEHFNRTVGNTTPFDRDFQDLVTEFCWGAAWGHGGLTRKERSMLNLGMLAALGRSQEFELHFRTALLRNGVSLEQLREVLIQIAVYCGIPAGVEAFRIARRVLEQEGIDLSGLAPRRAHAGQGA